jgi:hypothetical protein
MTIPDPALRKHSDYRDFTGEGGIMTEVLDTSVTFLPRGVWRVVLQSARGPTPGVVAVISRGEVLACLRDRGSIASS